MPKIKITLLLIAVLLNGCGEVVVFGHTVREGNKTTEVKVDTTPAATTVSNNAVAGAAKTAISPTNNPVKQVILAIAPQAAERFAKDSRFNMNALLGVIKTELQSRKLLDAANSQTSTTMEISIDDYLLRPTTNFAIFGYVPNIGTLAGTVILHDERGDTLPSHHVEAKAQVSVPSSGEVDNMLQPLYQQFAIEVVDSIAGAANKSDTVRDQPPR